MIKAIIAGAVGILAALAGMTIGHDLIFADTAAEKGEHAEALTRVTTELTGVPVIIGNQVQGYVVLRISSVIDAAKLPSTDVTAEPFLVDAAFRTTFGFAEHGITRIRSSDVEKLTNEIKQIANTQMGTDVVKQVNLEQFNFVNKAEIRGNMLTPE